MKEVKPRRPYKSAVRREQAVRTRARILDSAQRLFGEHGYGATTVEAIASDAGVATDTVYSTFRNKQGVLHALIDVRAGGDEAAVALIEREGPQSIRVEPDQRRQIVGFVGGVAEILERARPVDDIMRSAAAVDPGIAKLRARIHRSRYRSMHRFITWLAANGPLRDGLDEEDAAAIVWTLAAPEVHRLLLAERGWSRERYTAWLADTLIRTLLP